MHSRPQRGESASSMTPSRGAVSMPRDLSHTPAIAGVPSSAVQTPFIQKCHVRRSGNGGAQLQEPQQQQQQPQQPLEHMVVTFVEEDLQLTTTSLLGKGGFGRVYAARSNGGELYALKASSKKMSEGDWRRLKEEVALMSHFSRHPNVVRFIAAGRDEECAYVVMECCASRSLHDVIAHHGLELSEILWIGWALVDTIAFMHSKGCIHRDLKPQNLLFDFEGNLKITDFGLSSRMADAQPRKTVAGTAMYMAPEIASAVYKRMSNADERHPLQYGKEVDTWSVGVVLYVMMTRMNPYIEAMEKDGTSNMNKNEKTMVLFNAVAGAAWSWPPHWSGDQELCQVVDHILSRDPEKRATLQEVLDHPVWNRRPLSCPLSLMHKLNLLDRTSPPRYSSAQRSLSRVAENMPISAFRKSADDVLAEGMRRVVLTEQRARAQLALEQHETLHIIVEMLKLLRTEVDARQSITQDEERRRAIIQSQQLTRGRGRGRGRGGSEALVTADIEGSASVPFRRSSRSQRQTSVALIAAPNTSPEDESQARIVRASPDKYAVVYPGRETATRWSLRPVVSLPRDLNSMIEEFKCMNNHVMTKLTAMPHGYNGFDCNICDRGILKITVENPAFRCYKCDYDICMKCAYQGRFKDVNFICVSCTKKFTSAAKLRAHTLQCRGPSISPSPRRSSRMNTLLWDDPLQGRRSLLDVHLPDADPKPRRSGRSSTGRASSGGRITTGDAHIPSPEDLGALVVQHRDATFPDMPDWSPPTKKTAKRGGAVKSARRSSSNSDNSGSLSLELPPQVRLSQQQRVEKRAQPRSSAELRDIIEDNFPPSKKTRVEKTSESEREADTAVALKDSKEMASKAAAADAAAAAACSAAKEANLQQSTDQQKEQVQKNQNDGVIVIRAEAAARPVEVVKQPRVPRSVSARRQENAAAATVTKTAEMPLAQAVHSAPAVMSAQQHAQQMHTQQQQQQQQQQQYILQPVQPIKSRQPSTSGLTARGGPPLPRKGPGMPQNAPRSIAHALPPPNFSAPRHPLHPVGDGVLHQNAMAAAGAVSATAAGTGPGPAASSSSSGNHNNNNNGGGTGAFLALPREEQNRQRFVDDFLSGGWVRFYSFTNEETVVMYYCLQPGRYGAVFPTELGVGTAVVDIHSKLVLYVPNMSNESTNRSQPHPHVQTFYDEDVRLMSVSEAQRYLGSVLNSIMGFVSEIARLRAEGLTPAAVHAAYIHHRNRTSVPTDTKFVYVRKVFPDPSGAFTLFRLSNLRSQVVCNTLMDIRWQSDRRHNVGQKYYVHADGTSEPFVVDHTGILAQVETVLSNNFRR